MSKRLTIAIQKKGRLNQDSIDLITKSGISFSTNGERLLAKSSNFDIDILLVRDDDIPSLVEKKVADLGIVGENVLLEYKSVRKSSKTFNVLDLGFSKCKLAFAKPEGKKIKSLNNKKIATSYPGLVKKYLKENSLKADVIKINGSVELTPYVGIADCICDLVSSGATLEANNLVKFKELLTSQAVLIANSTSSKLKQKRISQLKERFKGVIDARESKYVMLNCDLSDSEKICNLLPGADAPTILPLKDKNKVAIHALCQEPVFWETMENLKKTGASSILVMPVEKVLN